MSTVDSFTQRVMNMILPAMAIIVPIVFVPLSTDFFTTSKKIVLLVVASVAILAWTWRGVLRKKFDFYISPATAPLIILCILYGVSTAFRAPNFWLALTGETTLFLTLSVIFLTVTALLKEQAVLVRTYHSLLLSASVVSLIVILQFFKIGQLLTAVPWLETPLFNPTGGPLTFLSLSVPLIAANAAFLYRHQPRPKPFYFLTTLLLVVASLLTVALLVMEKLQLMPLTAAWVIGIGALQNPGVALLGTGPGTYADVYTQLKPAFMNMTPTWNVVFSSSVNYFFQLLTTVGLPAVALYLYALGSTLAAASRQLTKNRWLKVYTALLLSCVGMQLILPPNLMLMLIVFISLSLVTIELKITQLSATLNPLQSSAAQMLGAPRRFWEQRFGAHEQKLSLLFWFMGLVITGGVLFYNYVLARAYASEIVFYRSLQAADQNNGTAVYNLQVQAINLKPYEPQYHLAYAQTNLALAESLAAKSEVNDQDKATITQLIEQAIREAKTAVQLQPTNSLAWQNLAAIYRQLIGLADGADEWTLTAYQQAIALDPSNPQLRLDLGGVFYSVKNYGEAVGYFTQAAQLKPDWANAYYNLAMAYRDGGEPQLAVQAMRVVAELIDPTSTEYQQVQTELKALEADLPTEITPPQPLPVSDDTEEEEVLTKPSPLPSPTLKEEIELPADVAPNSP
ncbi:MAG TPA: hypothetical protein VD999_03495 [Vitreimonas sp.]|nr:hypothetical protein [Vitreimonas sp.]